MDDNAFINPEYKLNLASRTGWQYDAWYLGQWNFPAGQYFKNFRPEIHVLGDDFKVPCATEWFAAMDYGYTHLNVVLLACRDHADDLYVWDECTGRYRIPQRHAQDIKAMLVRHNLFTGTEHLREHLLAQFPNHCSQRDALWWRSQSRRLARFVAGADMFSAESNGSSIAQQYRQLGFHLRPANMDRVSGWSAIAQRFGDPPAGIKPSLFIHKRCQALLACLPYLQHDPDRPGDVLKTNINDEGAGGDDPADALRYLVSSRSPTIRQVRLRGL